MLREWAWLYVAGIWLYVRATRPRNGRGTWAEIDPLLMMRPPRGVCAFIWRNACCVQRKAPVRLTSMTFCQASSVIRRASVSRVERPSTRRGCDA